MTHRTDPLASLRGSAAVPDPRARSTDVARRHALQTLTGAAAVGALSLSPNLARAQGATQSAAAIKEMVPKDFPTKPIRIIVPFAAGSGSDTGSRFYGEQLSRLLGQSVVVENRPGGSGMIAIQAVKSAPADGYTIMLASNSPMTVNPVVMKSLPYDPFKDFRPVIGIARGAVGFIVPANSKYTTLQEALDDARRNGKALTIGTYSAGYQLVAAWLQTVSGVTLTNVAYKGGAQIFNDLIGGQLDLGAVDFGGAAPMIKDGRIRALAQSGGQRHREFAQIPTVRESGYPEFETYVWSSLYVRAETPDNVTAKLVEAMQFVMASAESRDYMATQPSEPMAFRPDAMSRFQQAEFERFKRVAEAANIQPQ